VTFYWVALGLALHDLDWTTLVVLPIVYTAWTVRLTRRRRRNNA
jgi:hypothetical protein